MISTISANANGRDASERLKYVARLEMPIEQNRRIDFPKFVSSVKRNRKIIAH
jgi:hypothetical protein